MLFDQIVRLYLDGTMILKQILCHSKHATLLLSQLNFDPSVCIALALTPAGICRDPIGRAASAVGAWSEANAANAVRRDQQHRGKESK